MKLRTKRHTSSGATLTVIAFTRINEAEVILIDSFVIAFRKRSSVVCSHVTPWHFGRDFPLAMIYYCWQASRVKRFMLAPLFIPSDMGMLETLNCIAMVIFRLLYFQVGEICFQFFFLFIFSLSSWKWNIKKEVSFKEGGNKSRVYRTRHDTFQ